MTEDTVQVRPMSVDDVDGVVAAAVEGADPADVMPVDPADPAGPRRWTDARADGFAAFLRSRLRGEGDAAGERSYVVDVGRRPVGVARLRTTGSSVDTGIWLSRSVRGRGVAAAALGGLIEIARGSGAEVLVADTTTGNAAALAVLRRYSAELTERPDSSGIVDARIPLAG